jgi:hypothetical protein
MAQVACCPQCNHDLLVPVETAQESWAKCPECRAFFHLDQATALVLVESPSPGEESEPLDASGEPVEQRPETAAAGDTDADTTPDQPQSEVGLRSTAARIDEWFRSAQTLADVPPLETNKTLEDVPGHMGNHADFQLAESTEAPQSTAPWDDSQHMERLLADIETPPAETPLAETPAYDEMPAAAEPNVGSAETIAATSATELPMFEKSARGKPRRKRSVLRTLTMTAVAGVVGLALGYYALLWLRGPDGDFLDLAHYLPKAMLPAALQATPHPLPPIAPPVARRDAEEPEPAAANLADSPAESAEVQASFTTAEEPTPAGPQAGDDRYGIETVNSQPAEEPAPLDEPAAIPLIENTTIEEPAQITDAPSFTADELTAALETAQEAQSSLADGDFQDGREVQRAKALGYSALANLAEKASFVDASLNTNTEPIAASQQAAEKLFRQTLSDAHTRGEVAEILPLWIASPNRQNDGVFFAARLTRQQDAGTVIEYRGTIDTGESLTLLVPPALADRLEVSSRPLGVIGWILEQPAEHVTSYTGQASQAIWVSKLIPLE